MTAVEKILDVPQFAFLFCFDLKQNESICFLPSFLILQRCSSSAKLVSK